MNRKVTAPEPLPVKTYIIISVAGFLLSLFCLYYYLHYVQGQVSQSQGQQVFYIILIVFGIAASAMIFGVMNSYGAISGERMDTKFQFTGPAVGVILIVLGGLYLPHNPEPQTLSIRLMNEQGKPVTNGKVVLYFLHHTREQTIDAMGTAVFSDINEEDIKNKLKLNITSDGYSQLTIDTLLTRFDPLQLTLQQNHVVHISGHIADANDNPIKDVVVMADGTRFFANTASNGDYTFAISDASVGDELTLVTSHKDYKDKSRQLKIDREDMNIDFVLQPLAPSRK